MLSMNIINSVLSLLENLMYWFSTTASCLARHQYQPAYLVAHPTKNPTHTKPGYVFILAADSSVMIKDTNDWFTEMWHTLHFSTF